MSDPKQVRVYISVTEEEAAKLKAAIDEGKFKEFGLFSARQVGEPTEMSNEEWQRRIKDQGKDQSSSRDPS